MITICRPDNRFLRRRYHRCPVDECITEQVVRYEAWYGPTVWCCKCGDSWSGGELCTRPFARDWRRDAVRKARRLWDQATYGPPPSFTELFPEEHGRATS